MTHTILYYSIIIFTSIVIVCISSADSPGTFGLTINYSHHATRIHQIKAVEQEANKAVEVRHPNDPSRNTNKSNVLSRKVKDFLSGECVTIPD